METKKVKISLSPKKVAYFLLAIALLVAFIWWINSRENKSKKEGESKKELVMPREFGVADPGFEGKISSFISLNSKALVDKHDKIDQLSSLKISFSDRSVASVKIAEYFNAIGEGDYYRLSFWAKSDIITNKQLTLRIAEKEKIQDLGNFSLTENDDAKYFEFNFKAQNNAEDLILTSSDSIAGNVWLDNFLVEKIEVESDEELKGLKPTIFGKTTWKNVDKSQLIEGGDTGDFLSKPGRKIGQIFQPSKEILSGVAIKMFRRGTGGAGSFQLQIREFDEKLGVISENIISLANIDHALSAEALEEIKKRETQMREEAAKNEKDIKEGRKANDEDVDRYPENFSQTEIDTAKAVKRAARLEVAINDMKESYNTILEKNIPLTAKLDPKKKYWLGIGNSGVTVDQNNYISLITVPVISNSDNLIGSRFRTTVVAPQEANNGFMSETASNWTNSSTFWFKTLYPEHSSHENNRILSGATITDMGKGKMIYRYRFLPDDYSSLSAFSGRKFYDMTEGTFESLDAKGDISLAYDDFVTYQFNTVYPVNKIILRDIIFQQSLALEISTDGENWEEIFSDNPAEANRSIDPIVFNPNEKSPKFYLRVKSSGDTASLSGLSVEAQLEK